MDGNELQKKYLLNKYAEMPILELMSKLEKTENLLNAANCLLINAFIFMFEASEEKKRLYLADTAKREPALKELAQKYPVRKAVLTMPVHESVKNI